MTDPLEPAKAIQAGCVDKAGLAGGSVAGPITPEGRVVDR